MEFYSHLPDVQKAFRSKHSTETALLKVHSDIIEGLNKQNVVMLVLLDLSAALHSIYHEILLNVFQQDLGASDSVYI